MPKAACGFSQTPNKYILPRIVLHHRPLLWRVRGKDGKGFEGFRHRFQCDRARVMGLILLEEKIAGFTDSIMPQDPVVAYQE